MSSGAPSSKGENGRGKNGQFTIGWKGGPGNPFARRTGRLRAELYRVVTAQDMKEVIEALLGVAKKGDVAAATLLLQRLLGPPTDPEILDRLSRVESLLELSDRLSGNERSR